ncbi:hypothetical protein Tco_0784388 [Tanacetum coccineum]
MLLLSTFSKKFTIKKLTTSSSLSAGSKHILGMICKYMCFSPMNVQLSTLNSATKFPHNTEDNSSISGWVFLLGGGAISWASRNKLASLVQQLNLNLWQLAAAVKEAEWLRNLILEILFWSKTTSPISISCDSATTLAKTYSQMYNRKSRHLGVRHNMIRELITNGVISIEFVRSQQNLDDHLTKELARDLVIKSAKGMGLKSN